MSTQHKRTVVAVDDDEINLMILVKSVQDAGFAVKSFASGAEAWDYMHAYPGEADIAVLDKMMPGVGGVELLKQIKSEPALKFMPVILQTGDVGVAQMQEGLENGARYYLTKPFHPEVLTAILHSAAKECDMRDELHGQTGSGYGRLVTLMEEVEFTLKTHDEARMLAASLAQAADHPEYVMLGLTELLYNAIEHGNLNIGYDVKRSCLLAGNLAEEITVRMKNPLYSRRAVHVHMNRLPTGRLNIVIKDEGNGFNWRSYVNSDSVPEKCNEPGGRGIVKAMVMLDDIRYVGGGSEVHCRIGQPAYLSISPDVKHTAAN